MRGLLVLLALNLAAIQGNLIDMPVVIPDLRNPQLAYILYADGLQIYNNHCVGTIINNFSILSTTSCVQYQPHLFRVRVGTQYANAFGSIHHVASVKVHPESSRNGLAWQNDISIIRVTSAIEFSSLAQPASFAGAYVVPLGDEVETYGWSFIDEFYYEPIRKQSSQVISSGDCRQNFDLDFVNEDMICSVVKKDNPEGFYPLVQNFGSPLYHDGVVVGVASYLQETEAPVVHTKVASFIDWIRDNA